MTISGILKAVFDILLSFGLTFRGRLSIEHVSSENITAIGIDL